MQDRDIIYFLQTTNGIGKKTIKRLWDYFGNGEAVYHAQEKELQQVLQPSQLRTFLRERDKRIPGDELKKLEQRGILFYSVFDCRYPGRLRKIEDRPWGIFVRGTLPPEDELVIAVIGTRKHSYYGEKQTKLFSRMAAQKGIPIVSGMAKGIDGIAQKTALEYGGNTYAVLGCGVDVCYPEEHTALFEQLPVNGGIISEYPPGTVPAPGLFPMRNRIISGLCDVLLVMEAREKSGTLITVDMALEQGKEVWMLPGRVDDALSRGCNRLIAQGAGILPNIYEFEPELELLRKKYSADRRISENTESGEAALGIGKGGDRVDIDTSTELIQELPLLEKMIMEILDYQPLSLTSVCERMAAESRARYSIQQVSIALMELCMKKLVKQIGTNYYIRC